MSGFVDKLKKDHVEIMDALNQVKKSGLSSHEGRQILERLQNKLSEHLATEDKHLYPELRQAAVGDQNIRRTMEIFAKDMEAISETANQFFFRYGSGGSSLELAREFGRLYALMSERLRKEENILYEIFDDLTHA